MKKFLFHLKEYLVEIFNNCSKSWLCKVIKIDIMMIWLRLCPWFCVVSHGVLVSRSSVLLLVLLPGINWAPAMCLGLLITVMIEFKTVEITQTFLSFSLHLHFRWAIVELFTVGGGRRVVVYNTWEQSASHFKHVLVYILKEVILNYLNCWGFYPEILTS